MGTDAYTGILMGLWENAVTGGMSGALGFSVLFLLLQRMGVKKGVKIAVTIENS